MGGGVVAEEPPAADDCVPCCCCGCCDPSEGVADGGRFMVILEGERLRARPPLRLMAVVRGGGWPLAALDPAECKEVVDGGRLPLGDGAALVILTAIVECCCRDALDPSPGPLLLSPSCFGKSSFFSSSALVSVGILLSRIFLFLDSTITNLILQAMRTLQTV